jgi:L-alanine-DL-glutamate epimerase-like enolase superfamily enzyme
MKIVGHRSAIVELPADEPLADAPERPHGTRPTVVLELLTDDGLEGVGFTFLGAGLTRALHVAVQDLAELAVGHDPLCAESVLRRLRGAAEGAGPAGIFTLALSAIDIALWDLRAKAAGLPLWKLLGGAGEPVPTYASGALMRGLSLDAAVASAGRLVERGFRAMKMQLALPGDTTPAREIERARRIRERVGPDAELMCDVNQRWRVDEAITIGRRLEDVRFAWLEDVAAHDDYEGLARIAEALTTPLAGGEYVYGLAPFRHMLEARSVDVVMIDPFRVGGITNWLKVAGMAEAFNVPVVSHLAPEIQVHLVGSVRNGLTVEYMPWSVRLFEEVPWPAQGRLAMPTTPGLGLRFARDTRRHLGTA